MSEFEFLFTGIAIVLALAVARLLEGLRDCFDKDRRYWIHALWVVNRLLVAVAIFWSLFDDRARTDLGLAAFVSLVATPAILFLQASALVTAHPGAVSDWRDHFWTVRRWFFGSNLLMALAAPLVLAVNEGAGALAYAAPAAGLLISVVGLATANARIHGALAIVSTVIVGANLARFAMEA